MTGFIKTAYGMSASGSSTDSHSKPHLCHLCKIFPRNICPGPSHFICPERCITRPLPIQVLMLTGEKGLSSTWVIDCRWKSEFPGIQLTVLES